MNIGDSIYIIQNGQKKFGRITSFPDHNYVGIRFSDRTVELSVHRDKIGKTYFLSDKLPSTSSKKNNQKSQKFKTSKEEEQNCATTIIQHFDHELEELKNIYFQRNNKYEIEAFESAESIKRKTKYYEKIISDPFRHHLYYEKMGTSHSVRIGTFDVEIDNEKVVHSINSPIYGQLLMQNRLAINHIEIDLIKYLITKRRDIKFNNSTKRVTKVNEITFDNYMNHMTTENMDKHLVDSISQDELYQTRLKTNSAELQEIFWTMTGTQHQIVREPVDTPLIIQGGAGTGKTSVGIHRISYLLYNKYIQEAITLGPNEHFASYIKDSLSNMGIDHISHVSSLSRLEFYNQYLKKIQAYINKRSEVINNYLIDLSLNPISFNLDLIDSSTFYLAPIPQRVKQVTQTLNENISWNTLTNQMNKLQQKLKLSLTPPIFTLEEFFTSFETVLLATKQISEFNQLTISIKEKEEQLKQLLREDTSISMKLKKLETLATKIEKPDPNLELEIISIEEKYTKTEAQITFYKKQLTEAQNKYSYYFTKIEILFPKGLQYLDIEDWTTLGASEIILDYKQKLDLYQKLTSTTSILLTYLEEKYHVLEKEYNRLYEDYIRLHEQYDELQFNLNTVRKELKTTKLSITSLNLSLQSEKKKHQQLRQASAFTENDIHFINNTIKELVKRINNLTPSCILTPTYLNQLSLHAKQQQNILLWLHFYFTIFPSTQEFYRKTYFFIDEAQDIPTFEYVLFKNINCNRVLFAGDVNQNIFGYNNFKSWAKHCDFYQAKFYELQYNWRSTKPIVKEAQQFIINYDYENIGVVSGYPIIQKSIPSLKEFVQEINEDWIKEKLSSIPATKSCAIIAMNKVQFNLLKILFSDYIKNKLINVFDGTTSIKTKKLTLTSIDYVKGLEFYSTVIPLPLIETLDQFEKARIYTTLTRATDDLNLYLIESEL